MHRDIKCLNIFLSDSKTIKLGDLGVSEIVPSGVTQQGTRIGTPLYLAPELVKNQQYDHKIDMWAIGCALYHLAGLETPFQGDNLVNLGNQIVNKRPKPLPPVYSVKFRMFVEGLLSKAPRDRPSAEEALEGMPGFIVKQKQKEESQRAVKPPKKPPTAAIQKSIPTSALNS